MTMKKLYPVISIIFGSVAWLLLFGLLRLLCVVNIPLFLDSLWVEEVEEGLVRNIVGEIAFQADGYGCEDRLIFNAPFYPDGMNGDSESRSLTQMIDLSSWQRIGSDSLSTTYADNSYRYVLYHTSDEINMRIFLK